MLTNGQDLGLAFAPEALQRLAEIKERVDPENLFRSNRALPGGILAR
ncbi:BBE domain-containing protein [Cryobacterium sp. SO2]|nr:BBE domain-containing protein [Cryobacterium sp. SO2]WEO75925.1 BBE domain-containing protein [Cryobacterium sp. SO2]